MNLPNRKVTNCICDGRIPEKMIHSLKSLGIKITFTSPLTSLPIPVACHPDMQVFDCENKSLVLSPNVDKELASSLAKIGFHTVNGVRAPEEKYPFDIPYNACLLGKTLFCNEKYTAPEVLSSAGKVIHVRQGYAKCSILPVSENAFITQDQGIYLAARKLNFDVLLFSPSEIRLDGYDNGFIGGCGGKISPDSLAFFGNAERLTGFSELYRFLENYHVHPVFLSDEALTDYGSLISLET